MVLVRFGPDASELSPGEQGLISFWYRLQVPASAVPNHHRNACYVKNIPGFLSTFFSYFFARTSEKQLNYHPTYS